MPSRTTHYPAPPGDPRPNGASFGYDGGDVLYRELFLRASTAFLIHRAGFVLRANQASATLLGFETPADMAGMNALDCVAASQRDAVGQQVAELEAAAVGTTAPSMLLPIQRRDGSAIDVLASMARVAVEEGPASLLVLTGVTACGQVERELTAAKELAEAANRRKSRFLANMSHEVRTPLNGIYGLAQLVLSGGPSEARQQEYLLQIVKSAEHLTCLLSDVLDLSKIEAGELVLESIVFDLHGLLESVALGYRGLAAKKGLSFAAHLDPALPHWVRGDPTRTRQIIANYVSNALKFTSAGGIALHASASDGPMVKLAVSDTGIGIDAPTQARLFKPFAQADDSTSRRYGGTGLGLSISAELAALLGGRVGIESDPGRGSTFWAELPLPAAQAPPAELHTPHPADGSDGANALAGVHLLLVEDNPVNMMIAMAMLERWGARVAPASNGRQAIELVETLGGFDSVLMDLHMPVMNGLDAAVQIRRQRNADELPIIAMTAAVLEQDLRDAYEAGMNDFVSKPFAADRLLATVARWTVARRSAAGSKALKETP